jgi:hypothetical protein
MNPAKPRNISARKFIFVSMVEEFFTDTLPADGMSAATKARFRHVPMAALEQNYTGANASVRVAMSVDGPARRLLRCGDLAAIEAKADVASARLKRRR